MFVAGFIGSPSMNFLRGKLQAHDNGLGFVVEHAGHHTVLPIPASHHNAIKHLRNKDGDIILGIRPEHVTDAASARRSETSSDYHPTEVDCLIDLTEPTGPDTLVFTSFNQERITCRTHPRAGATAGQPLRLAFDLSKAVFFDPETEQSLL